MINIKRSIILTLDCCNDCLNSNTLFQKPEHSSDSPESSCQNYAPKKIINNKLKQFIINQSSGTKNFAHATTITIGNKWIGKKSAKQQYKQLVRDIKRHIGYRSAVKYLYVFEYQHNGHLHAHGVELGSYQQQFIESFSKYGRRNSCSESFQTVKHIDKYLEYIDKEHAFPYITNIHKHQYKKIKIITPEMIQSILQSGRSPPRDVGENERSEVTTKLK